MTAQEGTGYMSGSNRDTWRPTLSGFVQGERAVLHQGRPSEMWPTPDASVAQDGETPETWMARRDKLKVQANNGNGCGTPLAMAVTMWPTPNVPTGGRCYREGSISATGQTADGRKRQVALEHIAKTASTELWPTPRAEERKQCNSRDDYVALSKATELWPTPTTKDNQGCPSIASHGPGCRAARAALENPEFWTTPAARDHKSGLASTETLERNARPLNEQVESMWATPMASDGSKPSAGNRRSDDLSHQAQATLPGERLSGRPRGSRPQLNPAFVCWMMGWPIWWTHPEWTNSDARAMASWFDRQHADCLLLLGERD